MSTNYHNPAKPENATAKLAIYATPAFCEKKRNFREKKQTAQIMEMCRTSTAKLSFPRAAKPNVMAWRSAMESASA